MASRLHEKYRKETIPALAKRFGYKNTMAVPRVSKVTLNIGLGEASQNVKLLDTAAIELGQIAGQKPVITRAKKSIANFKIRKGMPIGLSLIHISGIIIGRKGSEIDKLKGEVQKRTKREVHIDIQEVHRPELDATLVAESIALQLEKRVAFRRAMRKAVDSALRFGCKGIKVRVAGRLNGAEIARKEWYLQGQMCIRDRFCPGQAAVWRSQEIQRGLHGHRRPARKSRPRKCYLRPVSYTHLC